MQAIITPHKYWRVGIAIIVALLGVLVAFVAMRPAHALGANTGEHIITVHDDGVDKGFVTEASTVRDALKDGGIRLDAKDRTEPALDEKLVANSYQINIYRARPVLIRDGANEVTVITAYRTGEQIAADAGLTLRSEDDVELSPSTDPIADGAAEIMTITRATPFIFEFYGKKEQAYTQASTVAEMLKEKGIVMTAADGTKPSLDTPITANMNVRLWREGVQTVTVEEDVEFSTKTIQDADQPVGYRKVQTEGKNGRRMVTYEITTKDGVEVKREEINSTSIKKATEEVVVVGTKVDLPAGSHEDWMAAAGISSSDYGYVNFIVSHENRSWDPCKVQGGAVDCNYDGGLGYGLVQATPGTKMASAGSDWRTNPITQLKWATSYAVGRYGSWEGAYNFWNTNHWW